MRKKHKILLHHEVDVAFRLDDLIQPDDVRMIELAHHVNFTKDFLVHLFGS